MNYTKQQVIEYGASLLAAQDSLPENANLDKICADTHFAKHFESVEEEIHGGYCDTPIEPTECKENEEVCCGQGCHTPLLK